MLINFDSLPVETIVFEQFPGLRFPGRPSIIRPSIGAASGTQALANIRAGEEFNTRPLIIEFSAPQSFVRLRAGLDRSSSTAVQATLRAFDPEDGVIAQDGPTSLGPELTDIRTLMQVEVTTPSIVRVELEYSNTFVEVIDNLEFGIVSSTQSPNKESAMNKISGKIVLKESGLGIPDLLVVIYDFDPRTQPEETMAETSAGSSFPPSATTQEQVSGDRLGSVLTDKAGKFELAYKDSEFQIRNQEEKRPDLLLAVLAPEEIGRDLNSRILYSSTSIRQNAGRLETYLIRLTQEQLKEAGISIPSGPTQESAKVIEGIVEGYKIKDEINFGVRKLQARRIKRVHEQTQKFNSELKPNLVKALSGVSKDLAESDTFVSSGQSIKEKTEALIKQRIDSISNVAVLTGHFKLTEEQKQKLIDDGFQDNNGDFVDVPDEVIEPMMFGPQASGDRSVVLLKDDPMARFCREKTLGEECLEEDEGADEEADNNEDTDESGNNIELITSEDVPRYVASLVNTITSPEEAVAFGVANQGKRAGQDDVQKNVDAFLLNSGPADVPAFYDFHNLQIAFEHVWQEAIDEGILKLSEDAYKEIVELGGSPCVDPFNVVPGAVVDFVDCFQREVDNLEHISNEDPPFLVIQAFDITVEQWNNLTKVQQDVLENVAGQTLVDNLDENLRRRLRQQGERIIRYGDVKASAGSGRLTRLHKILRDLNKRIREEFPFTIYAADRQERSINFGTLVTYRQKWEPISYQAGELVKTVALAPKEVRKFSKKTVVKKKRAEKEVESSLQSHKQESSETARSEAEIIRKAQRKTNFTLTTQGSTDILLSDGSVSSTFSNEASTTSSEVKKDFREAVFKASQEFKNERKIEVTTEESFEEEFTESGEIMNPNEELAVTFLFYELQRRYRISEQIHRLTPVILVAQEVPKPHEIDEDWLIAHDWILKRVILDDTFIPALNYLSTNIVGDEFALKELQKNIDQQRLITERLGEELVPIREQVSRRYATLERSIQRRADVVAGEDTEGILEKGIEFFTGSGSGESEEAARIREEAAKDAYERAVREEKELRARLEREVTALNEITERYTKLLSEHLNRKTQVARLRVHVKQNILYYMQAIWSHEPHDQQFFRLHKVQVPVLSGKRNYSIVGVPTASKVALPELGVGTHDYSVTTEIESEFDTVDLVEVADLNNPLGFKGNYIIFPLTKSNALTDFMMRPYVDNAFEGFMNLHDPDEFGNFSLEDFSKYVCCLKKEKPDEFDELEPQLKEIFERLLKSPQRTNEEIIVPTDSLFIEALPSKHPILEDFKLLHRAIDVKKVQAEVREMELENIRHAARILSSEDDSSLLDDPDIESVKKVFVSSDKVQPSIDVGEDS